MSAILHPKNIARNLVRVSGSGYRENIELKEAGERARHAEVAISRFQAGVTGAGITLSRLADFSKPRSVGIVAYLGERRDTAQPLL
ncbi:MULTISPECIES: hypothetical protein [Rhizobium/Agrobacterium group]|jgi:hypothetical protein|uniref:Uncharacterized protein n=2 Tax=Neorhizobium TaxID=1525371 RepID=A0ABV0LVJ1_9HYPH|nr:MULTISPECIES: hypothetical protein [Rhizobium/Agrobacterium group]KGD86205.1 hypothetical protein JL39_29025 [Rhizobium sp. YS-1r]MCC2608615.1 hypothetical protein [Neorhizobium petrolearium]WGI68878.1 hypothetical protein QEO92_01935 [Neorhizobium petrolearium]